MSFGFVDVMDLVVQKESPFKKICFSVIENFPI